MRKSLWIVLAVMVVAVGAPSAHADSSSLTLISSGSGIYDYGITVPGGQDISFLQNQTITLTGLSDVTGASVSGALLGDSFAVSSFTSTSVTFVQTGIAGFSGAITFGDFLVDSTAPLGTVNWSMETQSGTLSGTVGGPVATAPEPSSAALMLLGVGLVFVMRKRNSRGHQLAT